MQIIQNVAEWKTIRRHIAGDKSVGFVPTMGNLHQGHRSLIQQSTQENEITVLSIFVNPTQFNNAEDFHAYPNTLHEDKLFAENAKVDYLFCPNYQELYPDNYTYKISENHISQMLEGCHRPGHFDGVLTVVMKLLLLIQPHHAYFGEKDYQQLKLVQGLAQAFFLDTEIISCATVREESGLALSSRNNRLNDLQKQKAHRFAEIFHRGLNCQQIKQELIENGFSLDYIEEYAGRRFAAIKIDDIRLIDNYALNEESK